MFFIKRIYLLSFCFVFALSTYAQVINKAIALKTILQSIEKQHHVNFNYIDNEIEVYKIIPPKKSFTLNEKIIYLRMYIEAAIDFSDEEIDFIDTGFASHIMRLMPAALRHVKLGKLGI